jgi:hypothetical protein
MFHNLTTEPPIGKWFTFLSMTRGSVRMKSSDQKLPVYQTSPLSKIEELSHSCRADFQVPIP